MKSDKRRAFIVEEQARANPPNIIAIYTPLISEQRKSPRGTIMRNCLLVSSATQSHPRALFAFAFLRWLSICTQLGCCVLSLCWFTFWCGGSFRFRRAIKILMLIPTSVSDFPAQDVLQNEIDISPNKRIHDRYNTKRWTKWVASNHFEQRGSTNFDVLHSLFFSLFLVALLLLGSQQFYVYSIDGRVTQTPNGHPDLPPKYEDVVKDPNYVRRS